MPDPAPPSADSGLRHALTTAQLTMIAIGGAIGTGLFLGSGFAIRLAGPGVLASYAIGALIALLLMGSLAEMSAADPAPGSFGLYAERYLSPFAGFLVRYSYWACVVLAVGTEVSAVAVYMHYWLPNVPGWVWVLAFSAALVAINALQVGAFGAVEYIFSLIKVVAICGFILLGGYLVLRNTHTASANLFGHGGFLPHGAWGAWQAVDVAIFSYFSLEMVAVAAGEARDPRTAVVRAFRGTVIRLILFYLGTLAVTLALVPWTATAAGSSSPFVLVMQSTAIPYAAGILNLVVLIAALSAMNSQLYITSRMMFSLARAGYAPSGLGKLTSAGVPARALLLSSLGIGVAFLLQALAPAKAFGIMLAISTFGAMFTWTMIFVTHLNFRRGFHGNLPFRLALYPATPLLGALLMLALIVTTAFVPGFELTLVFGIPFLLLLTIIYFAFFRSRSSAAETTAL
jgi:AAT family amino acid transporter